MIMVRTHKGTFSKLARFIKPLKARPDRFLEINIYLPNNYERGGVSVKHASGKYSFWSMADITAVLS